LTDIIGGNLTFAFSSLPVVLPFVRSGQLTGLAVTSLERTPSAPEYATLAELGVPGFESVAWNALYAPASVPKHVIDRINVDAVKVLKMPDVQARFRQLGIEVVGNTPEAFAAFQQEEVARWKEVIQSANIQLD